MNYNMRLKTLTHSHEHTHDNGVTHTHIHTHRRSQVGGCVNKAAGLEHKHLHKPSLKYVHPNSPQVSLRD